jgi:chromosome segregation ATPase
LDNFTIGIEYEYNPLWLSFRPTIWVWTLAIVGCAVVVIARRQPKGPTRIAVPTAAVKVRPDYLKSFIDAYEEKMKINLETETLEERVQKGKVPRRRYKVRTKMLETRLNTLSRTLADFKEKMRASGGKYAEMMLQLEVAESEIDEVGANIKNAEAQHNRGELSLEAYRKRLADYQHRKENAETTINGILLRLREETR